MIGIYKIINELNQDCYIGSSIKIKSRWTRHKKDLKNGNHHSIILQRSVEKYGIENFKFLILEECLKEDLLIREQYYLDLEKPKYNISLTAGSCLGCKQSKEVKEKRRQYAIDNNIKPPDSTWKDKQESVLMLEYNTLEILQKFNSLSEACRYLGKDSTFASTISSCCKNKRFSAYGYRWVFKEEDIPNLRNKKEIIPWNKGKKIESNKGKKVYQYDLNNIFIKEWDSVKEAEIQVGKGVGNCARGISKTSNGYKWTFNKDEYEK